MVEIRCSAGCEICGGVGFVRFDLPVSDPGFGKIHPCPNIDRAKFPNRACGLAEDELVLSWSGVLDLNNARRIARTIKEMECGQVFLHGQYGVGKTRILKTAIAQAARTGLQARYVTTTGFLDDLRLSFDTDNPNANIYGRLKFWSSLPVLALDELDRESSTPFAQERLSQILDERWQGAIAGRLLTLFASNARPEELPGYLNSRISDGRCLVVEMTGTDLRPGMTIQHDPQQMAIV